MKTTTKLLAISAVLLAIPAAHSATSGTLTLSGTIGSIISIVVTPNAAASSLDLTSSQTDLLVGTVSESSNAINGYRILAKSTNASKIKHSTASDFVGYTMKYGGGSAVTLTTSDQAVKNQTVGGNYNGVSSNVTVSYTGSSSLTAGSYSDLITFTIEAL